MHILVGIVLFFIVFGMIGKCSEEQQQREHEVQQLINEREYEAQQQIQQERYEASQEAMFFVSGIVPELIERLEEIQEEISNANTNISKLRNLAYKFPKQVDIINISIDKWEKLSGSLNRSYSTIQNSIDRAFVLYKVNEIQGRQSFEKKKKELLKNANDTLALATTVKMELSRLQFEE